MKLGFITVPFGSRSLEEVADWAAANGFGCLEICCWPLASGDTRRYAGVTHVDVDALDQAKADEIRGMLDAKGIDISALGYYPNPLHPDPEQRAAVVGHLEKVIDAAPLLGVGTVTTFAGNDKDRSVPENMEIFRKVWTPLVARAEERGVRIAIENCPMIFSFDEWPAGNNVAYSPAIWREMFEAIPSEALGLNFDPSHLVWQMIDIERAIDEFAPRIYHVHAKDLEIDRNGLYDNGISRSAWAGRCRVSPVSARSAGTALLRRPLPQRLRRPGRHRARGQRGSRARTSLSSAGSSSPGTCWRRSWCEAHESRSVSSTGSQEACRLSVPESETAPIGVDGVDPMLIRAVVLEHDGSLASGGNVRHDERRGGDDRDPRRCSPPRASRAIRSNRLDASKLDGRNGRVEVACDCVCDYDATREAAPRNRMPRRNTPCPHVSRLH